MGTKTENSNSNRTSFPGADQPPTRGRNQPLDYDKALYRQRHRIENIFTKLKDWRRIATRYDRCSHTFSSTICVVATVTFYLNQ